MSYVLLAAEVPDQEKQYYAGPKREITRRMAHMVTPLLDDATKFVTSEEAEAMGKELGGGYNVVSVEG